MHALPCNKISQNFTNFQIHEVFVAVETNHLFQNKEFNISEGLFVYAELQKHFRLVFYGGFFIKIVLVRMCVVSYRT